jgi:hypothetical protein
MTAKQRAARAKFKAIVKEASKLRKKNPKLTQAQAVKQAWAISYSKQKAGKKLGETHKDTKSHNVNIRVVSGIKKKKKIGSAYLDRLKEKQAKAEREREAERTKKQRPAAASKRVREVLKRQGLKMPSGYKVAERVISGTQTDIVSKYVKANQDIEKLERVLIRNKETQKKTPYKTDFWRKHFSYQNKLVKKYISELKKHKAELKKLM